MPTSALQVSHPQPVGCRRGEPAPHQISRTRSCRVGDRGALDLAAHRPGQTELSHQPLDGAAGHLDTLTVERQPHLACPIHPVVRRVHPFDLGLEARITDLAPGGLAVDMLVIRRWGDLNAELTQPGADRLDTPPQTAGTAAALMLTDEANDQ